MSQKSSVPPTRVPAEKLVRDIRRARRKHHSAEDKIRIVLEGLRGEESIAALCRREAIVACCWFGGHEDKIVTHEPESGYDETEVQPRVQD